ncbi:MAG TPA: PRC-barrel domain-containing protein [Devosia sp.]|jgi:sporulation protein YlmC with PRC-barrel domain|nr:PRC-barrel domain-containing protein [Devosia sp.]
MARTSTAIALVATLVATPALAQTTYQYSDFDLDGNLELTDVEFEQYSASIIERYDTDRDSYISAEEFVILDREVGPFNQPFETWDTDADRRLATSEFNTGLFGVYDTNRDLMVDETEYGLYGGTETVGGMDNTVQSNEVITLADWRYDDLYGQGVSVEELMDDMEVWGVTGEEIGSVENVLFGADGQVLALVAEVGGFWDIGDTHVSIPWDMVEVGLENIVVPVTEDTVGDYSVFNEGYAYDDAYVTATSAATDIQEVGGDGFDTLETGPSVWRATDLIGDYARIRDADTYQNYGYVNDIIIRDGEIAATVISADAGYGAPGYYAYPYTGYAGGDYYDVPYGRTEVDTLEPYDYNRMAY